jgi:hypothetical protein
VIDHVRPKRDANTPGENRHRAIPAEPTPSTPDFPESDDDHRDEQREQQKPAVLTLDHEKVGGIECQVAPVGGTPVAAKQPPLIKVLDCSINQRKPMPRAVSPDDADPGDQVPDWGVHHQVQSDDSH